MNSGHLVDPAAPWEADDVQTDLDRAATEPLEAARRAVACAATAVVASANLDPVLARREALMNLHATLSDAQAALDSLSRIVEQPMQWTLRR